jgi:hypothetical protein
MPTDKATSAVRGDDGKCPNGGAACDGPAAGTQAFTFASATRDADAKCAAVTAYKGDGATADGVAADVPPLAIATE